MFQNNITLWKEVFQLAAPLMIIRKVIQNGNKLQIILYESARETDISTFFLVTITAENLRIDVADAILKKSQIDKTAFSKGLMTVRDTRELIISLPSEEPLNRIEFGFRDVVRVMEVE